MMLSQPSEPAVEAAPTLALPRRAGAGNRDNRVAKNVTLLSGSLVATSLLTALWTLVVPRRLGPDGMGFIVIAWSATNIFQALGSLGLRNFMVRELAADWRRAPQLVGSAIMLRLAAVVPFFAVVAVYLRLGHFEAAHALVLYLATAIALFTLLCDPLLSALWAIERLEYQAYADVINKALLSLCGIVLVLLGFGATAFVALMAFAAAVVLGLSFVWSRRYFTIDWQIRPSLLRQIVRDSLPYWSYALFSSFYLWVDSAMLAVLTSTAIVGWYGGPTKLFGFMMFIPVIVLTAWLPRLVAAFTESPERLREVARVPTEQIMILSLPVGVGALLVADPLIRTLYGHAFDGSVPVFAILALAVPATYFNIVAYQILVAAKRQITWTKAIIVASVANPALNLLLIRVFQHRFQNGAIGAALSFMLTEWALTVVGLLVVRQFLQSHTLSTLARSALATIGMAVGVVAARPLGLIAQIVVGALSFAILAVLFRVVTPDDVRNFGRQLRSRWQTIKARRWRAGRRQPAAGKRHGHPHELRVDAPQDGGVLAPESAAKLIVGAEAGIIQPSDQ
jgi:O-antigen/teichoic acid export membrane protein